MGEVLGGLTHGEAERFDFLRCALGAGETMAFGAVEAEVSLTC